VHFKSTINWLAIVVLGAITAARIVHPATAAEKETKNEVDTQFIFGFTAGADVGELGEKELEHQTIARLGKRGGAYAAVSDELRAEFVPEANFRFEVGIPAAFHDITGVQGLADRHQAAVDGLAMEFRYLLLDRAHAPFALTIAAEAHWSRVDETTGEPVDNYGGELSIVADKELIKDRVFGAINLIYDPEITHLRATGLWQREATLGLFTPLTTQVRTGLFLGGEVRYLRRYEGFDLDPFVGHALFIGPTMFARLSKTFAISGAWDVQVVGHAVNAAGTLDLTNFTRQQVMFRLEYNF